MIKQLTVISGKGGTGKTSITAALASMAKNAVFADCDVDAADLHLILRPEVKKTTDFYGLKIASIDHDACTRCGACIEHCKFDAIDEAINLIKQRCEGCAVCEYVCPVNAISMKDRHSGYAYISDTRFGPMSHAMLKTAEEASGKLVAVVRNNATDIAMKTGRNIILIDGPPGTGCPVIAAITGVDLVMVVTEPTLSAIHDLERIVGVASHFNIPVIVCINKYNINAENSKRIEEYCNLKEIPVVGKLAYDTVVTKAMLAEKTVIEYSDGELSLGIKQLWNNVKKQLMG